MPRRVALLLALLLSAPGSVLASSAVETPLAVVLVQDDRPDDCMEGAVRLCQWTTEGEGGDAEVDAYQKLVYVGAAPSDVSLLPDDGLLLRGSDVYVRHPFIAAVTHAWNAHEPSYPGDEHVWLELNEQMALIHYPTPGNASAPLRESEWNFTYVEDGVAYDHLGPYNKPTGNTTDNYASAPVEENCFGPAADACAEAAGSARQTARDETPNVRLGLEFYDVEVATTPDALTGVRAGASPASPIVLTRSVTTADEPHARRPAAPAQDASRGPSEAAPTPVRAAPTLQGEPDSAAASPTSRPLPPAPAKDAALSLLIGIALSTLAACVASLYTRATTPEEILRSPARDALMRLVAASPGIHVTDAARAMGVTRNAALYHVRVLARGRLIRVVETGSRTMLYPQSAAPPTAGGALLQTYPIARRVLGVVESQGGAADRALVHERLADVPLRSRNHNLRWLIERGFLAQEGSRLVARGPDAPYLGGATLASAATSRSFSPTVL